MQMVKKEYFRVFSWNFWRMTNKWDDQLTERQNFHTAATMSTTTTVNTATTVSFETNAEASYIKVNISGNIAGKVELNQKTLCAYIPSKRTN